jgi:hypothetical protein
VRRRIFWPVAILGDMAVLLLSPPNQPDSYYLLCGLVVAAIAWLVSEG